MVWPTKYRQPLMSGDRKYLVINCIHEIARQKEITIHALDGHVDHLHVLLELRPGQDIARMAKFIKGASAFHINKHALIEPKLIWARGYFWSYVPPKYFYAVKMYIENQEKHHGNI